MLDRLSSDAPRTQTPPKKIGTAPLRRVLRDAIRASDLSQSEIARRSGLHRSRVSLILNGQRAGSVESWEAMLEACDIQIGYRFKTREELR